MGGRTADFGCETEGEAVLPPEFESADRKHGPPSRPNAPAVRRRSGLRRGTRQPSRTQERRFAGEDEGPAAPEDPIFDPGEHRPLLTLLRGQCGQGRTVHYSARSSRVGARAGRGS